MCSPVKNSNASILNRHVDGRAYVVAGLVAQQQCCGPLQLPVADVAVMAQSHQGLTGAATAIGEQPLKGLIDAAAMARMALGEAVTNLFWAAATSLADVKASVNWMCVFSDTAPYLCHRNSSLHRYHVG